MKNKKLIFAICIFLILAIAITGCRPARRPVPEEPMPGEPGAPPVPGQPAPRELAPGDPARQPEPMPREGVPEERDPMLRQDPGTAAPAQ